MPPTLQPRSAEILLVEDNPGDARLAREALADSRIRNRIHHVVNGDDALAFLRGQGRFKDANRPDLVLLDLNLPGLHGSEVLEAIKSDPDLRTIPVIVLTTSSSDLDVLRSYALQANSYVVKPLDLEKFSKAVGATQDLWFEVVRLPRDPQQH